MKKKTAWEQMHEDVRKDMYNACKVIAKHSKQARGGTIDISAMLNGLVDFLAEKTKEDGGSDEKVALVIKNCAKFMISVAKEEAEEDEEN